MGRIFKFVMNKVKDVGNWYTENYINKSCGRFETFKLALSLLYTNTDYPTILETGTVRMDNDFGAGYSTYIFSECVYIFGGKLITIDNSLQNIKTSQRITLKYAENVTYIHDDSIHAINEFTDTIDLLYLDSYDCPIEGDASDAQLHNLNEFMVAENKLSNNKLILIDDVDFANGGKGMKTHEYLLKNSYKMLLKGQQSIWTKNEYTN